MSNRLFTFEEVENVLNKLLKRRTVSYRKVSHLQVNIKEKILF